MHRDPGYGITLSPYDPNVRITFVKLVNYLESNKILAAMMSRQGFGLGTEVDYTMRQSCVPCE